MKSVRNRGKREIVNPIFLECKQLCENEYWKNVFEEMAYGKYPKQIYISNQTILSSNKKKNFSYQMRDQSPNDVMVNTISILTNFTDLISSEEIKKKKDSNDAFKKDNWVLWKDIKRKYIKDVLIMNFCLELKKEYNLTAQKSASLYQGLTYRIYSGQITDIIMDDQKISVIPALEINPETKEITYHEEFDSKLEQTHELEDYMHHYYRRYLLKLAKLNRKAELDEE